MVLTGHARVDARSIELHSAIAEKLRADPALLEIAHANLARWIAQGGRSQPYWTRWQELLALPLEVLLNLIVDDSETMKALRQCTPFAGILTPRERWQIYDSFAAGTSDSSLSGHRRR
jgi:hypothetical protein